MRRLTLLGAAILILAVGGLMLGIDVIAQAPNRKDVPKFINTLKTSKDNSARRQAAEGIGEVGRILAPAAKPAIPTLIDVVKKKDDDTAVRRACAETLGMIAADGEKVVPILRAILVDDKEPLGLRTGAATALGLFASDGRAAIDDLRKVANENKGKDMPKDKQALAKAAGTAIQNLSGGKQK